MEKDSSGVTRILDRVRQGSEGAKDELVAALYDRLRQRAHIRLRQERPGHSLATTDVTNETLLRLLKGDEFAKASNTHELMRAFTRAMRQLLIDHARRRKAVVHGGSRQREELDDVAEEVQESSRLDLLALDELLTALTADYQREAAVVEMRYFGGCELAEIAEALDVSVSTVERDSRFALAWLRERLAR